MCETIGSSGCRVKFPAALSNIKWVRSGGRNTYLPQATAHTAAWPRMRSFTPFFWMKLLWQNMGMSVNGENEHHLAASTSCMGCAGRLSDRDRGPTRGTSERLVLPPLTPSGLSRPSISCGAAAPFAHPAIHPASGNSCLSYSMSSCNGSTFVHNRVVRLSQHFQQLDFEIGSVQ